MPLPAAVGRRIAVTTLVLGVCAALAHAGAAPPPLTPELERMVRERAADADLAAPGRSVTPLPKPVPPVEEIAPTPPADADGVWSLLAPPFGRYGHSVVLDPRRRQLVMFGGSGDMVFDELWLLKLDGVPAWHGAQTPGAHPSPRQGHRMVYDPAGDRMILYGGYDEGAYFDDVWELRLDGDATWRLLGTGPPARAYPAMVIDVASGSVLVHGGFDGEALGDLWRMTLGADDVTAAPVVTAGPGPAARTQHTALLDAAGRLLVYGGQAGGIFEDTWVLKLDGIPTWKEIASTQTPGPRYGQGSVLEPTLDRAVIFGGFDALNEYRADSWTFDFEREQWERFAVNPIPSGRVYPGLDYDPVTGHIVMFGGFSPYESHLGDLWSLDIAGVGGWASLLRGPSPPLRRNHALAFDPTRERAILYGGQAAGSTSTRNDTWFLSTREPGRWIPSAQVPAIGGRAQHSAIVDPVRDRLLVFGGFGGSAFNDVWALPLGDNGPWNVLRPAGEAPLARVDHGAVYDPVRDRMIIMGGLLNIAMNDTWALSLAEPPVWTALAPVGSISPRRNHVMVYDSRRDRILVHGGEFSGNIRNDTWALWLDPPRWERLRPDGEVPPPVQSLCGIYDPVRDRLVILQPASGSSDRAELWALPMSGRFEWRRLEPIGVPPANGTFPVATYDPVGDRMLVQPGIVSGASEARVWALRFHPAFGARRADRVPATPAVHEGIDGSPNPARDRIVLTARAGPAGATALTVVDLAGRTVRQFEDVPRGAGPAVREWDLRDGAGVRVAPGIYLAIAESGGRRSVRRIAVLE
jgi:Kelch motif/Galactose oxidase, central domain